MSDLATLVVASDLVAAGQVMGLLMVAGAMSVNGHQAEAQSIYCRHCGAHPRWWSIKRCTHKRVSPKHRRWH